MIPRLRMLAGPNGSGKSTLARQLTDDYAVNLYKYLNADMLFAEISQSCKTACPFGVDNQDLLDFINNSTYPESCKIPFREHLITIDEDDYFVFAPQAINSYTVAMAADFFKDQYLKRHLSFSFETVFSHPAKIEILKKAQAEGFRTYMLPEIILHRPGFALRRVFMAPEDIHYPIRRGWGVSGIVNVTLSLPCENCISEDLTLCFPGGAKAVDICELTSVRRAKKVNLTVVEKQGRSGWEFAMRFAARLRKEHIDFSVKLLTGNNCQELNMKKFRKALVDQGLVVPAELSDDFEGNLISFLESKHPELIPGVLHKGALMLASGTFSPEVAFYLATSVRHGCWDGRWQSVKRSCKVTLFADKYSLSQLEKTKILIGVDIRSGNISLEKARELVQDSGLVIFASEDMHNDKTRFHALVKFCLEHDISVIVFTDNPDHFVQRIAYSHYILTSQRNGLNTEYCFGSAEIPFGVKFTLNGEWQLSSCCDMKQADIADKFKMSGDSPVSNGIEDFKECSSDKICNALFDNDPLAF